MHKKVPLHPLNDAQDDHLHDELIGSSYMDAQKAIYCHKVADAFQVFANSQKAQSQSGPLTLLGNSTTLSPPTPLFTICSGIGISYRPALAFFTSQFLARPLSGGLVLLASAATTTTTGPSNSLVPLDLKQERSWERCCRVVAVHLPGFP